MALFTFSENGGFDVKQALDKYEVLELIKSVTLTEQQIKEIVGISQQVQLV